MPAANIQRAIDRVADKNSAALEITYEGYGWRRKGLSLKQPPITRNRTLPEVKWLGKNGGSMVLALCFNLTAKGLFGWRRRRRSIVAST